MAAKAILIFCAQALLIQSAFSQCFDRTAAIAPAFAAPCGFGSASWVYDGLAGAEYGLVDNALAYDAAYTTSIAPGYVTAPAFDFTPAYGIAPASGGTLPISSASPIAPSGVNVRSDNMIEGILAVTGSMPFVSAIAMEGALPTIGSGAISYGCGNGAIGIMSESGYGAAVADVTYGNALAYGNGLAYGNDLTYGNNQVYGNGLAYSNALPYGNGLAYGNDLVYGNNHVYGNGLAYSNALAYDNAMTYGNGLAYGNNVAYDGVLGPSYAGC